jgi:hypothetical protein
MSTIEEALVPIDAGLLATVTGGSPGYKRTETSAGFGLHYKRSEEWSDLSYRARLIEQACDHASTIRGRVNVKRSGACQLRYLDPPE